MCVGRLVYTDTMKMKSKNKSYTQTVILIEDFRDDSLNDLYRFALACAGETQSSIFGYDHKIVDDFSGDEIRQYMRFTLYTD